MTLLFWLEKGRSEEILCVIQLHGNIICPHSDDDIYSLLFFIVRERERRYIVYFVMMVRLGNLLSVVDGSNSWADIGKYIQLRGGEEC